MHIHLADSPLSKNIVVHGPHCKKVTNGISFETNQLSQLCFSFFFWHILML